MLYKYLYVVIIFLASIPVTAQYTLNGDAIKNDCHCYTLTNDTYNKTGSVWNNNKISLTQSFDFKFEIFLGCADNGGADGIAFVLQPISTSVGSLGGGLGYSGVTPAVGVTIDTWQNGDSINTGPDGDPFYDHISIQLNGDLNHKDSIAPLPVNNIAGPVTALDGSNNIEDCKWHSLRIKWDEPTKKLSAYIDGVLRVSAVKDFTRDVFGGHPLVFWGFTGSTGGAKNLQQMCIALKPVYRFLPKQKRCLGEKITFYDSTISFAPLQKSYWNFGDGSPIDSVNLNPVHTYLAAGNYTVTQTVLGADGCTEVNTQPVIIGSIPIAKFGFNNACVLDSAVNFIDSSTATVGTINSWYWDFGNGDLSTTRNPSKKFLAPGFITVKLVAKSLEGCISDTTSNLVEIFEKPKADFTFTDSQCVNVSVKLNGISSVNNGTIDVWNWLLDSNTRYSVQNISNLFILSGQHKISLATKSNNGCYSTVLDQLITILPSPALLIKNTVTCLSAPVFFIDSVITNSTISIINYWWDLGNGVVATTKTSNTIYNLPGDKNIMLVGKAANGCYTDTAKKIINIPSKPLAKFGYALPLCDNKTILFLDSSTVVYGTINKWSWIFDDGTTSSFKNSTAKLSSGNHTVNLVVTTSKGCNSDTAALNILVNPKPVVDFNANSSCKNISVSFIADNKSSINIIKWHWNLDRGIAADIKNTQHVFTVNGDYNIQLFGVSDAGCTSDTVKKIITIYGTQAFAGNDTIAATNQPIQLQAIGGVSYEWSPPFGLNSTTIYNPIATNDKDRSYVLKAFTLLGCVSYDTINIKVYNGPEIYVPRAFTPNGDGINEMANALPVGVKQFLNFSIFNRLGQVVFTTNNFFKGWNGIYNGQIQNSGAYMWIASAIDFNGKKLFRSGTIMLVR